MNPRFGEMVDGAKNNIVQWSTLVDPTLDHMTGDEGAAAAEVTTEEAIATEEMPPVDADPPAEQ